MRASRAVLIPLFSLIACWSAPSLAEQSESEQVTEQIIALEQAALERWVRADPQGYIDLYLPDVSYFDPTLESRIDGIAEMERHLAPMRGAQLPFTDPRLEFVRPTVQQFGDVALFTFNIISHGRLRGQNSESVLARWNATEVYRRTPTGWRIVHSHWSYTKPNAKPAAL